MYGKATSRTIPLAAASTWLSSMCSYLSYSLFNNAKISPVTGILARTQRSYNTADSRTVLVTRLLDLAHDPFSIALTLER